MLTLTTAPPAVDEQLTERPPAPDHSDGAAPVRAIDRLLERVEPGGQLFACAGQIPADTDSRDRLRYLPL